MTTPRHPHPPTHTHTFPLPHSPPPPSPGNINIKLSHTTVCLSAGPCGDVMFATHLSLRVFYDLPCFLSLCNNSVPVKLCTAPLTPHHHHHHPPFPILVPISGHKWALSKTDSNKRCGSLKSKPCKLLLHHTFRKQICL